MPLLYPIGIMPVWALCHSLYSRQQKLGPPENGVRRLELVNGSWKSPELRSWTSAANMVTRCKKLLSERAAEWSIGYVVMEMLDPHSALPWTPGKDGEIEAHIGVVTNPFSRLYAAAEAYAVGWGEVVISEPNSRAMRSASNFADTPRVHMIFGLERKPEDG